MRPSQISIWDKALADNPEAPELLPSVAAINSLPLHDRTPRLIKTKIWVPVVLAALLIGGDICDVQFGRREEIVGHNR